jgi:hypothetical protein
MLARLRHDFGRENRTRQQSRNKTTVNAVTTDVRFLLGHRWVLVAAFATLVTVCSMTVHPFGAPKQSQAQVASMDDLKLPAEITTIFKRSYGLPLEPDNLALV